MTNTRHTGNRPQGTPTGSGASRHIIIGDIHGCADELFALLEACDRGPEDEVVSVGDLIDRGPDPEAVIRFFMDDPNSAAILGNHEDKHVRMRTGELAGGRAQMLSQIQLGDFYDAALDWFETLPLTLERAGHFICHGGVIPGVPLDEQPRSALLRGKMPWMKNIFDNSATPWWDRYDGDVPVIYGHSTHARGVLIANNTWGLDTGACHGHSLSALILPEGRVVSVPAGADHFGTLLAKHRDAITAQERRARTNRSEARQRKKAAKRSANKPSAPPPVIVEGVTLHGGWVLAQSSRPPGPWIGQVLADLRERVANGTLTSLEDARSLVPRD
jgi:serine/threonine protein phosphatase 1